MRLLLTTLVLTTLAGPLLACTAGPACAQSVLRLNEIMAGPSVDWNGDGVYSSRDDEWVELVNTASYTLALEGFLLTDADSIPRFALSGSLGPGERLLVTGKQSYDWEKATGQPAYGLSLGNTADAALLWRIAGPETLLVDSYAYTSHQAAADRSVGRSPEGTGGWVLFDALNPYTGGLTPGATGCHPSPAALNVCSTTPSRPVTWGRLKTLYR